jgi:hypothetical protein
MPGSQTGYNFVNFPNGGGYNPQQITKNMHLLAVKWVFINLKIFLEQQLIALKLLSVYSIQFNLKFWLLIWSLQAQFSNRIKYCF